MGSSTEPEAETQEVRQYRFLLATCPTDALLGLHDEMLLTLDTVHVEQLLDTVRDRTGTGVHLTPHRFSDIARLYVLSEHRGAGTVRDSLPPETLRALAGAALRSEAAFGRFAGYADWDGLDRETPLPEGDDGFTPRSWDSRSASGPVVVLPHYLSNGPNKF